MGKIIRDTKQRTAILDALRNAEHPLSPKQIQAYAENDSPGLGIATVYRNIRQLVEDREIEALEVPGGGTCYLLPRTDHRAILICKHTKRVCLSDCISVKIDRDYLPKGFKFEGFEVFVTGRFVEEE